MSHKEDIFNDSGPGLSDFLPDTSSGYTAYAGTPLAQPAQAELQPLIDALKTVKDPEIPVNIYDLGLIYDVNCHASGDVEVKMSLTAPGCPVAGEMPQQVADRLAEIDTIGRVSVTLVWDPPWTPERMSEDAKLALDYGF